MKCVVRECGAAATHGRCCQAHREAFDRIRAELGKPGSKAKKAAAVVVKRAPDPALILALAVHEHGPIGLHELAKVSGLSARSIGRHYPAAAMQGWIESRKHIYRALGSPPEGTGIPEQIARLLHERGPMDAKELAAAVSLSERATERKIRQASDNGWLARQQGLSFLPAQRPEPVQPQEHSDALEAA